jgi:molybdate transport system substrate-binding protein
VIASYPVATLNDSRSRADAKAFMDFVLSADGQKVLADYGFLPAP